ncbi:HDIG domain-containing protein [filamentous cyanobacterium LEGE 11480]|uniref:HDIG domain-containing protein n=1 Tax=Romeriopsis navalis LEGE 11480 TaxID=2777977 RepID=A0A928Z3L0_9CYAN|nr:HDIG domain-containing metalloprotein [Romeriopsis navalis]MBE9029405.1 HDIG domain-containing protein [Romeriopsis navalis LEGE 11480]
MIIKLISRAIQTQVENRLNALLPKQFVKSLRQSPISRTAIGITIVLIMSMAFGEKFYAQPQLQAGDIAPQTIVAPKAEQVEDPVATALKKQAARQVFPVFMVDEPKTSTSQAQLRQVLKESSQLRQKLGEFPIVPSYILSQDVQQALRRASPEAWQQVIQGLDNPLQLSPLADWQRKAIAQLQQRREQLTRNPGQDPDLRSVFEPLINARQRYQDALATTKEQSLSQSGFEHSAVLLDLSEADWQILKRELPSLADRILTQGLSVGLPQETHKKAFLMHIQASLPKSTHQLAVRILLESLEPNIVADIDQTQQRADEAVRNVTPAVINVKANQIIVEANTTIQPQQALLLEHFKLDRRTVNLRKFLQFTLLMGGCLAIFYILAKRIYPIIATQDYALIFLLMLSAAILNMVGVPSINLPMIGLLLGSFYSPLLAILTVFGVSSLLPIGMGLTLKPILASLAGGVLAAAYSSQLRSREDSVLLGILVGVTQSTVYFMLGWLTQMTWAELARLTALYGALGLAWCILAIGISPYLERTFDLVTTIRLVELANLNRPLLKRLAADTPGTFQHTLAVANLAEAAGKELNCNVELIRTGTLYHDIGKMHDPLGFIENQMGRENKHDIIDDPWISAEIIKKHVTEGIVMAKRSGLPRAVRVFIPEHQGAQLISYFHHKALQRQTQDPSITIQDSDFRYAGPNPRSRETGIVMLADSCEAALRTIKDATPEVAANMIQKIFRARWKEGALSESGLSRRDLDRIAEIFLQVWQQSNHQRIAYPQ